MPGRGAGVARTFGVGEAGGSNPLVPKSLESKSRAAIAAWLLTLEPLGRSRSSQVMGRDAKWSIFFRIRHHLQCQMESRLGRLDYN